MPVCPSSRSFHPALEAYLRSFGRKEPLDLALPHPSPDRQPIGERVGGVRSGRGSIVGTRSIPTHSVTDDQFGTHDGGAACMGEQRRGRMIRNAGINVTDG